MSPRPWLLAALWSLSTALSAAPEVERENQFYGVTGIAPSEIRASLERSGPVGRNGRRFHASTRWNVEWGLRWIQSGPRCQLHRPQVSLKITLLMPRLEPANGRSETTLQQWQNYYQALYDHELEHADIALRAANELQAVLGDLQGWMACDRLEQRVNDRADEVLEKYVEMEQEFDRRTDHGARDGVVLPWATATGFR